MRAGGGGGGGGGVGLGGGVREDGTSEACVKIYKKKIGGGGGSGGGGAGVRVRGVRVDVKGEVKLL